MNCESLKKVIAIDFDGCLCRNEYPEIGAPYWDVIKMAAKEKEAGACLILWTCREGKLLQDAVDACSRWGLEFDAVNESMPEWIEFYGNDSRKVGASEYWDDKAVTVYGSMKLVFSERRKLAATFDKWATENGAAKTPEGVIAFLSSIGAINAEKARAAIREAAGDEETPEV